MQNAFVLGAGLGTLLKKLTATLPKPLIPVYQRPLITYAFDHLIDLGIDRFVINTHHLAGAYDGAFPDRLYRGASIEFRHEPELLETGGGIANVGDLLGEELFIVYNGDILTDLPLQEAKRVHMASDNVVTLVLRSSGPANHVAWDQSSGKITDIRNLAETGDPGSCQFTGVYFVEPGFKDLFEVGVKKSVIPVFLDLIRASRLGGVLADGGHWWDLGDRESYLDAHAAMRGVAFPAYDPDEAGLTAIHASASVHENAQILGASCLGANAQVGDGAVVEHTVVWPGASVEAGACLKRCVVRSGERVSGAHQNEDL